MLSFRSDLRPAVSTTNFAPVIQVQSWLLLAFVILSMGTRFLTKFIISRRLGLDDLFASIGLILAGGETACILLATNAGLASASADAPMQQLDTALKMQYAADLLFVPGLVATKISVLFFLGTITPVKWHNWVLRTLGATVSVWGLTAVFTLAFQCASPSPWNYISARCVNRLALDQYIAALNIITDVALVLLPVVMIVPLKTAWSRRLTMVACFGSRILVVGAILAQLVELPRFINSEDPVLDVWPYLLCMQYTQALSLITVCIPYLKPFLQSLQAGALRTDDGTIRLYRDTLANGSRNRATRREYIEIQREHNSRIAHDSASHASNVAQNSTSDSFWSWTLRSHTEDGDRPAPSLPPIGTAL